MPYAYAAHESTRVFSTASSLSTPKSHPASLTVGSGRGDFYRPSLTTTSNAIDTKLLQSLNQLNIGSSDSTMPAASSFSSPSATPEHLRWFDPKTANDDHLKPAITSAEAAPGSLVSPTTHALPCSSSIGLNPYGTQLAFAYADEMDKFLSEKFHFSPSARMGKKSESGGAVEGTSDQIRRDSAAHVAAKYEWNHWNSGGGFGNLETAPIAFEDLPFAPPSRLTFLRDDPMEVRGANGSNGFDVYVR